MLRQRLVLIGGRQPDRCGVCSPVEDALTVKRLDEEFDD